MPGSKSKSEVQQALEQIQPPKPSRSKGPLWQGPEKDGITYSLLSRFLSCRERFRLLVVEGWKSSEGFSPPLEFGSMWHICEEAYAKKVEWRLPLMEYCKKLCRSHPTQQDQVGHWYEKAVALFPRYIEYWKEHHDVKNGRRLLQEYEFNVHRKLPSGRLVRMRGKMDALDAIPSEAKGLGEFLYLQENKTKSTIDAGKIMRRLAFDLQTMFYLTALTELKDHAFFNRSHKSWRDLPIGGVRYNVVRRAQHVTVESMLRKMDKDFEDGREDEWFSRFHCQVHRHDVEKFCQQTLDPVLEQLCRWWDMVTTRTDPFSPSNNKDHIFHWRTPYDYNPLAEGGSGDLDAYLESGSTVGLTQVDNLFPELS